ncbi:calpain-1 catalytic subunit-like [Garra rufa]|uniref:calpain-1 catalytic subunit-like n=1 Tax=Garra rufa TaxID=137080 RepID=UPI003CCE8A51
MGEWNGAWSDKSSLWYKVNVKERTECRSLVSDKDGEFWMSMEDFTKNFKEIDICCLRPDFLDSSSKCSWTTTHYNGSWESGTTAGGCINNKESFWTNPQFRVRIEELDAECASGQCPENILVSLMQIHENRYRSLVSNYSIGFSVYLVSINNNSTGLTENLTEYSDFGFHLLMVCFMFFCFNRYHQRQVKYNSSLIVLNSINTFVLLCKEK